MSELDFGTMLEDFLPGNEKIGDKVSGVLVRIDLEYGYLNLNNKLEGRIRIDEIKDLEIGSNIDVLVVKKDEEFLIVSKRLLEKNEAFLNLKKGNRVKGRVIKKDRFSYLVNLGLLNANLPFKFANFSKEYIPNGEEFEFEIIDKNKKNVILSRTNVIKEKEKEFFLTHNIGDVVSGEIIEKTSFGYIVNLENINALLHNLEVNWLHSEKKNLKVGDKVEAKIIEIDKENRKVKLSLKEMIENPWISKKSKYEIGQNFETKVKEVLDFGVVVDLGNDDGFIHISDLYYKKTNNIKEEYKKGDIVFCEIIEINDEKERISLSARKVFDKFWENIEDVYNINDVISVNVNKVKSFGVFAKTDEGLEIFIPKSEFSYKNEKINFNIGDKLDVKLIEINKTDKNIVASIKKLGKSPWEIASSKYALNEIYELEVTDILESGVLVKLTDEFKGLILKKELIENVNVGDQIKAMVFSKNGDKNSILLSTKRISELEDKKELEELMKIYGAN